MALAVCPCLTLFTHTKGWRVGGRLKSRWGSGVEGRYRVELRLVGREEEKGQETYLYVPGR